ncbi:MAG: GIY-YIG nuclease family protein [Gemmatimonadetes bacterium]|nr:GIY-YIG nuclease family protein [Gemmatimonadota bacterium]
MATSRTVYKYHFKLGNRIVHTGITRDLDRREAEHQRKPGWDRGHIFQVGFRTTQEAALQWEAEQRRLGKPTGP